jgi:hypothetical protein
LYEQSSAFAPQTFLTSNSERMRITAAGNIGIGTTSPSEKLTVQGNIYASQGGFIAYRTDGGTGLDVNGGDLGPGSFIARFKDYSNNDKVVIKGNGNLGIGTTTPSTKLDVYSTESGNWTTTFINGSTGGHQIYTGYNNGTTRYGVFIQGGGNDSNSLDLAVDGKFVVRGDGNVGIGTTSPVANLSVVGTVNLGAQASGFSLSKRCEGHSRTALRAQRRTRGLL